MLPVDVGGMIPTITNDSDSTTTKVAEIGAILATGLQRLLERKSSHLSRCIEENPLDCHQVIEGHVRPNNKELAP